MKAAEIKTSTTSLQKKGQPFFEKGRGKGFFSDHGMDASFFRKNQNTRQVIQLQPKLTIGQPDDKYEKEADAVADKVVQRLAMPDVLTKKDTGVQTKSLASSITPIIQTKCSACEQEEKPQKKEEEYPVQESPLELQLKPIFESNAEPPDDKNNIQRKCAACDVVPTNKTEDKLEMKQEEEMPEESPLELKLKPIFESNAEPNDDESNEIQKKCTECEKEDKIQKKPGSSASQTASSNIECSLNSSKGGGSTIPVDTKEQMEGSFGADFSHVRIHTDSSAVQMSKDLHAQAFTHGSDIYFNANNYNSNSVGGRRLLAHELTHVVQQKGANKINIQRQDIPPDHLTKLNEMLNRFDVPEEEVLSLLPQLTPAEKVTVTTDVSYKNRMASAFDISEMVRAVTILSLPLEKKLEWVEASTSSASNIDYSHLQLMIIVAPQPERDGLKTTRWRNFFVDVCDNSTIINAVTDLHFDLKTQLEWIEEEASPTNIDYSEIQPLITVATQPDRDILKTTTWRDFFVGVCTNATIITAVTDLHFDLKTQLEWIEEEASPTNIDYSEIQPLITVAPQPDRDVLKTNTWRDFFVGVCTNATMVDAVTDLHFDLKTKLEWLMAEDCSYDEFKIVIVPAADKAAVLGDPGFLRTVKDFFLFWNDFAKCIELLGRAIPNAGALMADPTVQATLTSAWLSSSAALTCGGGPTAAHEEGGWIYLNLISGAITTQRAVSGGQASINLWSPSEVADSVIVGTFHTHPNVGPCWGSPFASPADVTNANNRGVPNIVRGAFPAVANISDVFGGPLQRLHLAGSTLFPGTAGGVNPQSPVNKEFDSE